MSQLFVIRLEHLSVLRFRGPDAARFLQGQLSNDIGRLRTQPALLAGLHDPQGRVLAILRLVALEENDLLALLPRELAPSIQRHLQKFVLRAKLTVSIADTEWQAYGLCGPDAEAAAHRSEYGIELLGRSVIAADHDRHRACNGSLDATRNRSIQEGNAGPRQFSAELARSDRRR